MNIKFYVPITETKMIKSVDNKKLKGKSIIGKIKGIASTPDLDYEQEQVVQEGLDISSFLEKGFLNWDHDNTKIVGFPDKKATKLTKQGLYVEGYLLDTEIGRMAWDTANALQKSGTDRRLGFSIEGQVIKQDKKGKILKARVTNIALTPTPVNPYTSWDTVAKSLTANATGNALIKESLENAKIYCQKGLDGDIEVLDSLNVLKNRLNQSENEDDERLYLMMFKGLYGEDLRQTYKKIKEI